MACGETISKSLIVAAIDFGTTFSGYAFALRHDYKVDHMLELVHISVTLIMVCHEI
jgi:hypothetical protein